MLEEEHKSLHFIEEIVEEDINNDKHNKRVHTRFPPEPNGYIHIGHAKSICLNFGIAEKYNGKTNLRFDDTNPTTEDIEYVNAIKNDIEWLGYKWENEFYASDYFEQLHNFALQLIKDEKAYVDDSRPEEIATMRGDLTTPGTNSPFRTRTIDENLDLFARMTVGEFDEGAKVLRAKIDMASPNMHMRDPIIYRIKKAHHFRTADKWCVYPMYDFAHGLSDALEKITHSLCTLEFEVHRPLYNWFLEELDTFRSRQIEFARLNLSYTITSKRKLLQLVTEGHVNGWDDPRMPTVSGMRRRGYSPESIRNFADRVGIARRENVIDFALLEFSVREHLNKITPRVMVVLDPLKVTITNYPNWYDEHLTAINNPEDESMGSRTMPFSRTVYIERGDFMENPPKKYFRLSVGNEVRLKNAYIIKCESVVKDADGKIIELKCTYDPTSKSGDDTSGKKVKGTLHWVAIPSALPIEIRLYDRLFNTADPIGTAKSEGKDFLDYVNPDSLSVITAYAEPSLRGLKAGKQLQFMRKGYFCVDPDSNSNKLVFNRTVTLRDGWAKKNKADNNKAQQQQQKQKRQQNNKDNRNNRG